MANILGPQRAFCSFIASLRLAWHHRSMWKPSESCCGAWKEGKNFTVSHWARDDMSIGWVKDCDIKMRQTLDVHLFWPMPAPSPSWEGKPQMRLGGVVLSTRNEQMVEVLLTRKVLTRSRHGLILWWENEGGSTRYLLPEPSVTVFRYLL